MHRCGESGWMGGATQSRASRCRSGLRHCHRAAWSASHATPFTLSRPANYAAMQNATATCTQTPHAGAHYSVSETQTQKWLSRQRAGEFQSRFVWRWNVGRWRRCGAREGERPASCLSHIDPVKGTSISSLHVLLFRTVLWRRATRDHRCMHKPGREPLMIEPHPRQPS